MGEISDALRRSRESAAATAAKPDAHPPVRETYGPALRPEPTRKADVPRVEISEPEGESWPSRVIVTDGQSASAEAARHIALRLRRELGRHQARSLAVVSSERGEGKTTVACNLGLAIASLSRGRVVALVDLDLRAPSVAEALGIRQSRGIDDVLRGSCRIDDVRVEIERPGLDVYPARLPEAHAHELLVGPAFAALVSELERRYEITVFDTPPMLLVPDAPVIIEHVGAAVAVSRAGRTRRKAFEKMLELLPPAKLIGTVLNDGVVPGSERQYGYYGVPRPE
jgi:Mrp family chromosome partitioning ATPase